MKITSIENFKITQYKNNNTAHRIHADEPTKPQEPSFKRRTTGGTIGIFAGEMLTLGIKALIGLTSAAGIIVIGALSMLGLGMLGYHIENKYLADSNTADTNAAVKLDK
ncbi:hypothetical protein J6S88_04025 [bacterium]|nr:hypothetical protein [bacterium]